jgi:hypothetical protein
MYINKNTTHFSIIFLPDFVLFSLCLARLCENANTQINDLAIRNKVHVKANKRSITIKLLKCFLRRTIIIILNLSKPN